MNIYKVIIYIMLFFFTLGAIDLGLHNRFGLADSFQKGFITSGKLFILMSGFICLAPVIAKILQPILGPSFKVIGADPSLFAGILLPSDAGGAQLAQHLALSDEAGLFSGYIVGSILGPTIVFSIPVSLASVENERERTCVVYGLLAGIITSPFGMLIGGIIAKFSINMILHNIFPILVFVLILFSLLLFFANFIVKLFIIIGEICLNINYFGLTVATIAKLSGVQLIPGMASIDDVFPIIGGIAIILGGAFPMIEFISRFFSKYISFFSKRMGITPTSFSGFLATTANSIATYGMLKNMDDKGKMLNVAFSVAAAWALGDHLGFTAQTEPSMLVPVVVSKLLSGLLAVITAMLLYHRLPKE